MSKGFILDVNLCSGCGNCQIVCKDEHCGQPWLPIADAQPEVGQFWCHVKDNVRGKVPHVWVSYVPTICGHCDECPILATAPDVAYRRDDGLVIIDPQAAKGRSDLVDLCPLGAVFWNDELQIPQKCTGCAHLLDNGWSVPRCVDACSTGALRFGDEADFADDIAAAEPYPELAETGSHVHVLNYPKRFVCGTVVDLSIDEVLIGADVTLTGSDGTVVATLQTDDFGDFKFDQVEADVYAVSVQAEGYAAYEVAADATDKDVAFTEIAMAQA